MKIWISVEGSDEGKTYDSEDIYPLALWLGKFINGYEDESFKTLYLREACEVYDLAHNQERDDG